MSNAATRPKPGTAPAKSDGLSEARREAALLKTGALQNAILTSANFSIIATDEKGVIQLFNVGAERMLGYLAAEVVNRINPSDIHDPQEVLARALALSAELGTTITPGFEALAFKASRGIEDIYELTYICKDGSRFPAIVSITALRDDFGAIIGYLLIGTDNSVRKQVESDLNEAMAAAEKANRAKTDFLSGMSHELRTPLNAILGFAQLMDSGMPAPTPSQKRSLDQILKAGWYLLELINEILDLALIESGKVMLSREPVSLVEVMLECRAMIEPQAQKRGIGMTFPRFETLRFVNADRTRVKQVLINLLFNAIKYNKAAGAVVVECVPIPPNSIRICVRDTGMGLSADQIAQLFQPFNRLGKEASVEEGTGIGLVVTKRLVELMGGVIGVESTVGVGSTFWIELGLTAAPHFTAPESAHRALAPAQAPATMPRRTLLYVEDNPGQPRTGGAIDRAPARPAPAERRRRQPGRRVRARLSAGRDPDGHPSARPERNRSAEDPARRPDDGAHPHHRAQRERGAAQHRDGPRGRVLRLSHQAHQGQPVHGRAGRGAAALANRTRTKFDGGEPMITLAPDILGARILIVDDQATNVALLEQLLGQEGYTRVTSTMNPKEVGALHRRNGYDLILLDLQMPGMDGFQVMEVLKTNDADAYLPVLVLTAQPGHRLQALQAGARDFISKPFDLVEVKTRIRNMLEVRLLYRKLEGYSVALEQTVRERTAELRESEARFRSLAELASDWYWEQDEAGNFTKVSGPVLEMLGLRVGALVGEGAQDAPAGWNEAERAVLQAKIADREPFLDFAFSRANADGSRQTFRVSGEPMFDRACRFIGYRGIGVETTEK